MHLDWIRSYVAVADRGSFLQAAQSLGRAQSRISEHVAKLEDELGITLIDRGTRPVKLTVAGEVLLGRARDILATIESARAEMVALRGSTYGAVRLASVSSAAALFVPRLIERFSHVEHNIEVQVLEGPTATLPGMLTKREADLAIVPLPYVKSVPEIVWNPLWEEPFMLVAHPSHRLADSATVTFADLANEAVITPGSGDGAHGLSPEIAELLTTASVQVGAARRVASPHTLVSMVRSGLGVGILSALALQLTGDDGVRVIAFSEPHAVRHMVLARCRDGRNSQGAQRFSDFTQSYRPPEGASRARPTGR